MSTATPSSGDSLTPEDIKKLTTDLSSEIDEEIKRQLSQPHPFSETQTKVNQVVKQVQEAKNKQDNLKLETEPERTIASTELRPQIPPPNLSTDIDPALANLDPLQASLNSALTNLKEGDRVGQEWVLKKIYSTSFGHNQSFFYELENNAGAKWTLSPEEMREVLKTRVQTKPTPEDLAPPPLQIEKKTDSTLKDQKEDSPSLEETKFNNKEDTSLTIPTDKTADPKNPQNLGLTQAQVEFINKLHKDSSLWQEFTSFSKEQLSEVQHLYEKGQLLKLGIDAHPLLDKISSSGLGKEVDIKKEDTFNTIVEKEGHSLFFSNKDAVLLGLHVLSNNKLLNETAKKAESVGLSMESVPEPKEVINLTTSALVGNNAALHKLAKLLQVLPTNSKFRVLSTEEVKDLEKYF